MCASENLLKYDSQREIIQDLSITLTRPGEMGGDVDQSAFEHSCQSGLSVKYDNDGALCQHIDILMQHH